MTAMLFAVMFIACGLKSTSDDAADDSNQAVNNTSAYTMEEVWFERDGLRIYGELYIPEISGKLPLVILSHGFGVNHTRSQGYARAFAENGIAAYAFDFIGGGQDIKSDGQMAEMSVLTEATDLDAMIDGLLAREKIDSSELYLFGVSQGGFVSTYAAGTRPDAVKGLIALYPAYIRQITHGAAHPIWRTRQ